MIIQLPWALVQVLQKKPQSAKNQHLCHIYLNNGGVLPNITVTNCQDADIPAERANFGSKDMIDIYVVPT